MECSHDEGEKSRNGMVFAYVIWLSTRERETFLILIAGAARRERFREVRRVVSDHLFSQLACVSIRLGGPSSGGCRTRDDWLKPNRVENSALICCDRFQSAGATSHRFRIFQAVPRDGADDSASLRDLRERTG